MTRNPFARKPLAQGVRPGRQRRRKAHDEQNDGIPFPPDALVFDVDAIRMDMRHKVILEWRLTKLAGAADVLYGEPLRGGNALVNVYTNLSYNDARRPPFKSWRLSH